MNDFEALLSTDYGFKPQGKSSPMASQKTSSSSTSKTSFNFEIGTSETTNRKPPTSIDDFSDLGDVFSKKIHNSSNSVSNSTSNVDFDTIFGGGGGGGLGFSSPVFDKPVYDDEGSSSAKYEDVLKKGGNDVFDDLLGGLGKKEPVSAKSKVDEKSSVSSFDDLLPGFGSRSGGSINWTSSEASKKTSSVIDDPFVVLESATSQPVSSSPGIFNDPLEDIGNLNKSDKKNTENSNEVVFDDIDPLAGLANSIPPFPSEFTGVEKDSNPFAAEDTSQKSSKIPEEDYSIPNVFEVPSRSTETSFRESNSHGYASPSSEENMGCSPDDLWLTVSEIALFTQPTVAPPPSRPPPPRPAHFYSAEYGSFPASNKPKNVEEKEYSFFHGSVPNFQSPKSATSGGKGSFASPLDELEEFAMGRNRSDEDRSSDVRSSEDFDSNSTAATSAAAMKEAMERAEAKFRHAKGVRERENAKAFRSKDSMEVEKDENPMYDDPEREFREHKEQLEREEEEKRKREEEERKRIEKEWEEKEREKRRIERERELARQAVERASREARERAAVEARVRAERVAVQRAQAEARQRAERAAVQRAQAEARERLAAGAKERAEKAAAEAREKAKEEAREKEAREREVREKEAREREVREKEASERAASSARMNQQRNENDLESFFGMGSRASSAPRPRDTSSDPFGTDQFQSKPAPEATRTSVNSSSSMRKASSSANIVDDLSSIFGANISPPSSNDFQEFEGETEDRRRARMERHQRTQERAAKALAEKNARDLEVQREQAERHRIAETLDVEIRRWAAGKEGNLRALLSTLQYVLWPECGWQPVSLTDLITGAAVKKVYRKATLCIHPDKVQQKGATLQQKYVAEKVFDLLKEAWNKFNSEELL